MIVGPIKYYAHAHTDEDPESEVENGIKVGLTKELAFHLANTNPLYEVEFDLWVNPEQHTYFVSAVRIGDQTLVSFMDEEKGIHIDEKRAKDYFDGYPEGFFD
jgi:hypothetical protein